MNTDYLDRLNSLYQPQRDYILTRAKHEYIRDNLNEVLKHSNPNAQLVNDYRDSESAYRTAVKNLLLFGQAEYVKLLGRALTESETSLFTDELWTYMIADVLDDWPQSRLIKALMSLRPQA